MMAAALGCRSGFAFADGRFGQGYADDGRAREAALNGFVEMVHVAGQEP